MSIIDHRLPSHNCLKNIPLHGAVYTLRGERWIKVRSQQATMTSSILDSLVIRPLEVSTVQTVCCQSAAWIWASKFTKCELDMKDSGEIIKLKIMPRIPLKWKWNFRWSKCWSDWAFTVLMNFYNTSGLTLVYGYCLCLFWSEASSCLQPLLEVCLT